MFGSCDSMRTLITRSCASLCARYRPWRSRPCKRSPFFPGFLGGLHLIEGFGLWLKQLWAEYLCIISTCVFIPLEVHEMIVDFDMLKLFTIVVNLGVVWYLARRIRRTRTS